MKDIENKKDERHVSFMEFEEYCIRSERAKRSKLGRFMDDTEPIILIIGIILAVITYALYN